MWSPPKRLQAVLTGGTFPSATVRACPLTVSPEASPALPAQRPCSGLGRTA
jgi:hypothetical protein